MDLAAIASQPAPQRSSAYLAALSRGGNNAEAVKQILTHALDDQHERISLAEGRKLVASLADALKAGQDLFLACEAALTVLQPRLVLYEEQDGMLREAMAHVLMTKEDFAGAAKILAGIDTRSSRFSDTERVERLVRIAELFLEDGESVDADLYINKASHLINACNDPNVKTRYKVSYARVLDSKRKFLEAAGRYYDLSTGSADAVGGLEVVEEDLAMLLTKSVVCVILGNAGPARTRLLGTLYKDDRTQNVREGTLFPVVEKMYQGRLIKRAELKGVEEALELHQKAKLSDGSTVLELAVVEHNVLSAGRVYENISFTELGGLLEIEPSKAARVASKMITEGRLQGSIDQVDGVLTFTGSMGTKTEEFDRKISDFCDAVNNWCDCVTSKYPVLT